MSQPVRCTFDHATPMGDVRSTFWVDDQSLRFESDDVFDPGAQTVPWSVVKEAATASMTGIKGEGMPDMARWVPGQIEWLMLVRSDGQPDFMRRIPGEPADRDALVKAVSERVGSRWTGERIPIAQARERLGAASRRQWSTPKTALLVISVLTLLFLLLLVLALLMHPVVLVPLLLAVAFWMVSRGVDNLSAANAVSGTRATSPADGSRLGFGAFQGTAVADEVSPSAITGGPCVWWDVSIQVYCEHEDSSDTTSGWNQVVARHGGTIGIIELESGGQRTPVWLKDADILLKHRVWESPADELPAPGMALLQEIGFRWGPGHRVRVVETGVELGAPLYVLGTLGRRSDIGTGASDGVVARTIRMTRTGEWRRALVRAMPRPLRMSVAALIGLLDIILGVGRGGERVQRAETAAPPATSPSSRVLWKGRSARPFVVSDREQPDTSASLRRQSWIHFGLGAVAAFFAISELFD